MIAMTDSLADTSNLGAAIKAAGQRKTDDTVLQVLLCVQKLDAKVTAHGQAGTAANASVQHELTEGRERMDHIERDLVAMTKVMQSTSGFIKGMHISGSILLFSLSILTWILMEKNTDLKSLTVTLQTATARDIEFMSSLKALNENQARDAALLEKHMAHDEETFRRLVESISTSGKKNDKR